MLQSTVAKTSNVKVIEREAILKNFKLKFKQINGVFTFINSKVYVNLAT